MKLLLKAPAKINWFLEILNKRDDGYHNILSAMQCVDLFDDLFFEKSDEIELISDLKIPPEDNLVYRAAVLLKKYSSYRGGAKIILKKYIPQAAGLGGGSSDAAYTLLGLNRLWELRLETKTIAGLASEIGSDVPFFIYGMFSIVQGRGEKVRALKNGSSVAMLLVKPDIAVPASWAYSSYRAAKLTKKHIDIKLFCQFLGKKDFTSLRSMISNDLEKPVIDKYHAVEDIKKTLIESGAVISSMSGSGPAVFGVFNSAEQAASASKNMGANWCRVVRTLKTDEQGETKV